MLGRSVRRQNVHWLTNLAYMAGAGALAMHGYDLYRETVRPEGALALTLANSASIVVFTLAILGLFLSANRPLRGLASLILGVAAAGSVVTVIDAGDAATVNAGWQTSAHIVLSVVAYSLLSVSAVFALAVAIQDRRLRQKKPLGVIGRLPSLETMESTLFTTLFAGFGLLSLAVFSGLVFVDDMLAQHLTHKAVLSIVAWVVFGAVLLGRWHLGWRGRGVAIGTLTGFAILALSYFGTRFVLEVLLGRQWG